MTRTVNQVLQTSIPYRIPAPRLIEHQKKIVMPKILFQELSPRKTVLAIFLFCFWLSVNAQNKQHVYGFQQEYWFGNLPGIRAEAMGRADVAVGGTASSVFYNPAGIGTIKSWEANLSTSAPFYVLTNSDYFFAGGAYRVHPRIVVGLGGNLLAVGETNFDLNLDGMRYPVDKPKIGVLSASIAGEPVKNLHLGLNFNLQGWKNFDDVPAATAFLLDFGALYALNLKRNNSQLRFGAAVVNINYPTITYTVPDGTTGTNAFPVIFRIGVAYEKEFSIKLPGVENRVPLALVATTEYQNIFNSAYRTAFRLGGELVMARVLAFRLGFFTTSANDFGVETNKSRINDITYGFGVIVPIDLITKGKAPFAIHLDYYALESPPTTDSGRRLPNRRGFGIRFVGTLDWKQKTDKTVDGER